MLRLFRRFNSSLFILLSILYISLFNYTDAYCTQNKQIRWANDSTVSKKDIKKVLVLIESDLGPAAQFCEDVISVEIMSAKISVVSREVRDREQYQRFVEQAKEVEERNTGTKRNTKPKQTDLLAIAKATGADALVLVNLVADTIQRNLYATDPLRVTEVRTDIAVQACSVTVVNTLSGRLELSGYVDYPKGTTLLNAARDIGQGLTKRLR